MAATGVLDTASRSLALIQGEQESGRWIEKRDQGGNPDSRTLGASRHIGSNTGGLTAGVSCQVQGVMLTI